MPALRQHAAPILKVDIGAAAVYEEVLLDQDPLVVFAFVARQAQFQLCDFFLGPLYSATAALPSVRAWRCVAQKHATLAQVGSGRPRRAKAPSWHLLMCGVYKGQCKDCLLYTSPSPRDGLLSRMPSSA